MLINVLTCYPDGRQVAEEMEVPDDYFDSPEKEAEE